MQANDKKLYDLARGAAIVAGIFSLIVCTLMIANFLQTKLQDPVNSKPLEVLLEQLGDDPSNETLQQQIRALDLLSRRAYFVNQWQLRAGAYMLLFGVIVLIAALKTMSNLQTKLPAPEGVPDDHEAWGVSSKARQWLAGLGVFLFGTAVIFAGFSYSELGDDEFDTTAVAAPTAADFLNNWANFRGPGGLGMTPAENPPRVWDISSGDGVKWKAEVPKPGYGSPIVWEDRLFLPGGDNQSLEVYCFDVEDGSLLWQKQVNAPNDGSLKEVRLHHDTGYAAPTMATNGRHVFAIFATGQIVCLDFEGNQIWTQDLGVPENHYGHSSSLLVYENLLIVQYDQSVDARLLALEVATGSTVWRVNREIISWSSPILVDTGNRQELIVTNSKFVESFDPKTGVKYWEVECLDGEHGPTPGYADGIVVAANEYSTATGIRLTDAGAEVAWEYFEGLPDAASPLVTEKFVILGASYGDVACVDAKTGEELWIHEFDQGFYASPILLGNLIYFAEKSGIMHVFEASSEFKSVGDFDFGEKIFSTPAFANGNLFVRTDTYVYCIAKQ